VLPKQLPAQRREHEAPRVLEAAKLEPKALLEKLESRAEGLTSQEAAERLTEMGPNVLASDQRRGFFTLLARAVANPLVILLAVLSSISFATGDLRAGLVMALMIALSLVLRLTQEMRADRAAARLKKMISVSATVRRDGTPKESPIAQLVPGDVVQLTAGDMVPGDVRIMQARDLFVIQGALTGESFPVEKFEHERDPECTAPLELTSVAYLGTSVSSGSAVGVVMATGRDTVLGGLAHALGEDAPPTDFDRGIARFTQLLLSLMGVMVVLVFVINGLTKGNWGDAFFFALAVAVGLTPEMLPMIVTVCLSKGAIAMGKKKVIVKRLQAIQNFGAMDVLCADKTGTLTMDQVILERHCDVALHESDEVLGLAYLNRHFQTGLKSVLDRAVLAHAERHAARVPEHQKVDEIPFDFERRIMSVVVRTSAGKDRIISKGAPEAIFPRCRDFALDGRVRPIHELELEQLRDEYRQLSSDGFRVLAIATRELEPRPAPTKGTTAYVQADETDLTLQGYVAFLDPPKSDAAEAIAALHAHGVQVKVITGDNDLVAKKVCREVRISTEHVLLGEEVEKLSDDELGVAAERATLFARVCPADKQRIVKALSARKHVVGFMGDGINDAPALHAADVGISVDSAVDVAKEAADVILLEKSLLVLDEGVIEGRKVFANIVKYVRMGASSNFGNMFSVLGASVFVPFLPMRPIQILANNLLYDLGQTAIPTDSVDPEQLQRPRPWDLGALTRFIVLIGPCSSVFDYTTFLMMLYLFGCWDVSTPTAAAHSASLFQTGWFVESLLTQTLIIHVIRTNKIPFVQSRSSSVLLWVSLVVMAAGVAIPFTPLGVSLGFSRLPPLYFPLLLATLVCYLALTQAVKTWLLARKWL
jgi:Mg2+-importing ATPase